LNVREFIQSLEIRLKLRTNEPSTINRIAQLTQKTNQFNTTTRRCTEADIEQYLKHDGAKVYGLEYEDKFGAEGIIGACLVERKGDCARIVNFLLSCRVLGRGVEFRFLRAVLEDLKAAGITQITAKYTQSPKNAVARDFYSNAGMLPTDDGCYHERVDQLMERLRSTHPA
jgi:FkbH-like protein